MSDCIPNLAVNAALTRDVITDIEVGLLSAENISPSASCRVGIIGAGEMPFKIEIMGALASRVIGVVGRGESVFRIDKVSPSASRESGLVGAGEVVFRIENVELTDCIVVPTVNVFEVEGNALEAPKELVATSTNWRTVVLLMAKLSVADVPVGFIETLPIVIAGGDDVGTNENVDAVRFAPVT